MFERNTVGCDLSETKTSGRVIWWSRPHYLMLLEKWESVGIKTLLWAVALKLASDMPHITFFCLCADVTLVPPVQQQQQQQNKSYILPPQYNRGLLALIFSQCVFEGPCAHILRKEAQLGSVQSGPGSPPSLFTWYFFCLLKDSGGFFARHRPKFSKYAPHPFPKDQND